MNARDQQVVTLGVDGMTCTACERRIEQALAQAGAHRPQADWRRGLVTFLIESGTDLGRFRDAVRAAGTPDHQYLAGDISLAPPSTSLERAGAADAFAADLLIIGSGSAAFAAAIEARQLGATVIMIEQNTLGGTCVNIGCVPSKFFLRAAEVAHLAATTPYQGVHTQLTQIDLPALRAQQRQLVQDLRREKYEELINFYGWEVVYGSAHFVDPETVAVGQRRLRARAILIATGARPALPSIPGLADVPYLTSTTALELERLPTTLVVLGAGFVALELGQAFLRLGTEVTFIQRRPRLFPELEPELANALQQALTHQGAHFLLGTQVTRVERSRDRIQVTIVHGGRTETLHSDAILVASGRVPNTDTLNLPAAGIAVDNRGALVLDATLRTTNPRVYAAGDVTLAPQFVSVAAAQGRRAARNALLAENQSLDLSVVPAVLFTDPQLATVGLTRTQATAAGYRVTSGFAPATIIARERVNQQQFGGVIVLADTDSGRLLGVQAVASSAGELIAAATLALLARLSVSELQNHLAPFLTTSEGLRLAALALTTDVARLSCCA